MAIMSNITEAKIPLGSLTNSYANAGAFVDCYYVDIPKEVTLEHYLEAFYTTPLFKVERTLLSVITCKFALDIEAKALSLGHSERYSIWTVEKRISDQIILRDVTKKTRSWLMVQKPSASKSETTRLMFGSVVIPKEITENGQGKFGILFHGLSRFHRRYSRALLNAAYKRLLKSQ
jgi:hypothetical protein